MGNPLDMFTGLAGSLKEGGDAAQAGYLASQQKAADAATLVTSTNQQQTLLKQQQAQSLAARGRRGTILTGLTASSAAPGTAATNTPVFSGDPTKGTATLLGQ